MGSCSPLQENGSGCGSGAECASLYCDSGLCCDGGVCCAAAESCGDGFAAPSVCLDADLCQGQAAVPACVASRCDSAPVDDDSACGSEPIVFTCEAPGGPATCTGEAEQSAPSCGLDCVDDSDCAATGACVDGICSPVIAEIEGEVDSEVLWSLHVARAADALTPAVAALLTLDYDPAELTVLGIETCVPLPANPLTDCVGKGETYCEDTFGPGLVCEAGSGRCATCSTLETSSDAIITSTGHTVKTCDQAPTTCDAGKLQLLLFGLASTPLSTAYLDEDGDIIGASAVLDVRFRKLTADPAEVAIDPGADFDATDADANVLQTTIAYPADPNPSPVMLTGGVVQP